MCVKNLSSRSSGKWNYLKQQDNRFDWTLMAGARLGIHIYESMNLINPEFICPRDDMVNECYFCTVPLRLFSFEFVQYNLVRWTLCAKHKIES